MSWRLAVDTSGARSFVAVGRGAAVVAESSSASTGTHDEDLAKAVKNVLAKAGIEASSLASLVVGAGPGSFTGLRIGYAFMKGVSLSLKIPLVAISSFRAMAWEWRDEAVSVSVVGDARREEVFFAQYGFSKDGLVVIREESIVAVCAVAGLPADAILVSQDSFSNILNVAREPNHVARSLLELADYECRNPIFDAAVLSGLTPNYLRLVSAKTIEERTRSQG